MKKLIRSVWNSKFGIYLRNASGIRTQYRKWWVKKEAFSASDNFLWRTDNGFSTEFRLTDIVGKFYDETSYIDMHIFDKMGRLINRLSFDISSGVKTITINANNALKNDYGTFAVFNRPNSNRDYKYAITNRCYTGYVKANTHPSFVHGNLISKLMTLSGSNKGKIESAFFNHRTRTDFFIQKNFSKFELNELVFANPMAYPITLNLLGDALVLKPGESKIYSFSGKDHAFVKISSDFYFPRPIIFSYKKNFFDVHHG